MRTSEPALSRPPQRPAAAMEEAALRESGAAASSGPLSAPAAAAGQERCPGGARTAAGGAAGPGPAEETAAPEPPDAADGNASAGPHGTAAAAARRSSDGSPSLRRSPRGAAAKKVSPWKSSPRKDQESSPLDLSVGQLIPTPQAKRRSWCRSSLKGTKRRKSLPPMHRDVTELSKSISLDLPETDRLSMLILSSFQFSAQKLEHVLKETEGFSPEAFKANVQSVLGDLKQYVLKLERDGTLRSCVEDPQGVSPDAALDESVVQVKEYIARFSAEGQAWDQLLLHWQERAEERARQLEQCRSEQGRAEALSYEGTSQAAVLSSKPDYGQVLREQSEVLSCVRLVLDELQQAAKVLQAFTEDSEQYLRQLSERLAARTFRQLESSPVRKLLAAPPRKRPAPDG